MSIETKFFIEKYHATENDFIFIENNALAHLNLNDLPALSNFAQKICHRRRSVGADGVVFYKVTRAPHLKCEILILNSDGSVAATCGNALRCLGLKLLEQKIWDGKTKISVESLLSQKSFATLMKAKPPHHGKSIVFVDMGQVKSVHLTPLIENSLVTFGKDVDFMTPLFVELENPHWVFISPHFAHFTEKMFCEFGILAQTELRNKVINTEVSVPLANIGMLTLLTQNNKKTHTFDLTVYERGAGLTSCCGSGATAARIALEFTQLIESETTEVKFKMPGGEVSISKEKTNNKEHYILSGEAQKVFAGEMA